MELASTTTTLVIILRSTAILELTLLTSAKYVQQALLSAYNEEIHNETIEEKRENLSSWQLLENTGVLFNIIEKLLGERIRPGSDDTQHAADNSQNFPRSIAELLFPLGIALCGASSGGASLVMISLLRLASRYPLLAVSAQHIACTI